MAPEVSEPPAASGLEAIEGIGPKTAEALAAAGFKTLDDLRNATEEALLEVKGIGKKTAEKIREAVQGGETSEEPKEEV